MKLFSLSPPGEGWGEGTGHLNSGPHNPRTFTYNA